MAKKTSNDVTIFSICEESNDDTRDMALPPLRWVMLPGVRTYTLSSIPSPPLVWIAGVPCLRIPPVGVADESNLPTILFFHGNASDLGTVWRQVHDMANHLNAVVVVMEFRGYGIHPIQHTDPTGIITDARRVLRSVVTTRNRRAHIVGYSIGAAIASELSGREPDHVASVTLVAPFSSLERMVHSKVGKLVGSILLTDPRLFDSEHWLKRIPQRVMVVLVHGTKDTVISVKHSHALHKALPLSVLEEQHHADHATIDWIRVGEIVQHQIATASNK